MQPSSNAPPRSSRQLWDYAPTGRDLLSGEPFPSGGSTDMDMDMDMDMKKDAGRRRRDMGGMMAMMHHGAATWVTPSKTRCGDPARPHA